MTISASIESRSSLAKLPAVVLLIMTSSAAAQEGSVYLGEGSGWETKYLTPNQVDTWFPDVVADETIQVHVDSWEFDPVIEFVAPDGTVLREVDDPGSESSFSCRAETEGEFEIQVHAYEHSGGGNYEINIERFVAAPIEPGVDVSATIDDERRSYHRWTANRRSSLRGSSRWVGVLHRVLRFIW